jgi:hypothetical protein
MSPWLSQRRVHLVRRSQQSDISLVNGEIRGHTSFSLSAACLKLPAFIKSLIAWCNADTAANHQFESYSRGNASWPSGLVFLYDFAALWNAFMASFCSFPCVRHAASLFISFIHTTTSMTHLSKACPDSFHLCSTLYALAAYYQLFSWHSVNKLACWNRSPASSHLVDDDPNHPTDDDPFFSAFASNSSPLDGIVYGIQLGGARAVQVVTQERWRVETPEDSGIF